MTTAAPSRAVGDRHARLPVDGGHLFVAQSGSGPPIVLLHGSRSSHAEWARLLPYLRPTHRCITLDFRGGGRSSPPPGGGEGTWDSTVRDVETAVRWSGAAHPLLVGASWGGKIALAYAARGHPCAGIVCVDGMAYGAAGTLHEDVYDRIACPIRIVVAERGVYPADGIDAFVRRHPQLPSPGLRPATSSTTRGPASSPP